MHRLFDGLDGLTERLEGVGRWLAPLGLRLLLAWEFWEAGRQKFGGSNWFMDIQGRFPFPFDQLPTSLSWTLATWTELLAAIALFIGLGTRVAAFALLVLTFVATAAVHWPSDWMMFSDLAQGYAITDRGHGNFKLPLLFVAMLVPLILSGPGRLSVDALLARISGRAGLHPYADLIGWGIVFVGFGLPLAALLPGIGFGMALFGIALIAGSRWLRH